MLFQVIRIEKLHGQMDPTARSRAYEKFCKSSGEEGAVLLATDVAARGIDVEAVQWIVQVGSEVWGVDMNTSMRRYTLYGNRIVYIHIYIYTEI